MILSSLKIKQSKLSTYFQHLFAFNNTFYTVRNKNRVCTCVNVEEKSAMAGNFNRSNSKNLDEDLLFFSQIDEPTKVWLDALQRTWGLWKKSQGVSITLTEYFETAPNPYLSALRILVNTNDFIHCKAKSSLAFTVMEEFSHWIETKKEIYPDCLTIDIKIAAFRLVLRQSHLQLIKLVVQVYECMKNKEVFLQMIENMIGERKYKEASQYATMLQLQHNFGDPEKLVLPLILQGKQGLVEEFLVDCPDIQTALIKYLDNLIDPSKDMYSLLDKFIVDNNINKIRIPTGQVKPMTKLIGRLVKIYNLPMDICPNLNEKRSEGAIQFLIHKRYNENGLSTESWREMVREAVDGNAKTQTDLLRLLIYANDAKEAFYWAKVFNIPEKQWPWALSYYKDQNSEEINNGASTSKEQESDEDTTIYHSFKLSRECITIVDDERTFEQFLDIGLRDIHIVGIDSEWKPSFGTKKTELALLQISTKNNVYILDVTTMSTSESDFARLWQELGLTLFENKHVLKLGFGIAHDTTMIREKLPALSKLKACGPGWLDLSHLWRKLSHEHRFKFPHEGDPTFVNESLSKLVELSLGNRLDKSDQFSNWEKRPLREDQITYAALDAYCLIEVYEQLSSNSLDQDIPFYDICQEIQHVSHKSPKPVTQNNQSPKPVTQNNQRTNETNHVLRPFMENQEESRQNRFNYTPFRGKQRGRGRGRWRGRGRGRGRGQERNLDEEQDGSLMRLDRNNFHPNQQPRRGNPHRRANHQINFQIRENNPRCDPLPSLSLLRPTVAHDWRVMCDSTLSELTDKLRSCGCDCVHILFDNDGLQSANLAKEDNRTLLTQNKNSQEFSKVLPTGKWYRVTKSTPDEQLIEVLKVFNVIVRPRDIFSRCRDCNYDEFVQVSPTSMDNLVKSFKKVRLLSNGSPSNNDVIYGSMNNGIRKALLVGNAPNRSWRLTQDTLDVTKCTTKYFMRVQIDKVPVHILQMMPEFYVCEHCGKVTWNDPREHQIIHNILRNVIVLN